MAHTSERMKGRRDGGLFVPIPVDVLESENFRTASPHPMKLLFALMAQLRMGKGGPSNNGDLSAPLQTMQKQWGFRSPDTLNNCKNELLDRGFIAETRKGAFPKLCTLYGIKRRSGYAASPQDRVMQPVVRSKSGRPRRIHRFVWCSFSDHTGTVVGARWLLRKGGFCDN